MVRLQFNVFPGSTCSQEYKLISRFFSNGNKKFWCNGLYFEMSCIVLLWVKAFLQTRHCLFLNEVAIAMGITVQHIFNKFSRVSSCTPHQRYDWKNIESHSFYTLASPKMIRSIAFFIF